MISILIPLYNEEESLVELHRQLCATLEPMGVAFEILFVDDGSRDRSWEVVRGIQGRDERVKAVRFRRNFGKACALNVGFEVVRGELVFTMDADLQDDPVEIPRFIGKLNEGLDVVSGWKRKRYDPWHKVGPSRIFNAMVSRMTGCRLHDHNCGFKLYRREVVRDVALYGELHRFVPVLAAARGFKVGEIEVHHRAREFGHSKYGWNRMFKGFMDLLAVAARTRFGGRPMHLLGGLGFVGVVLGSVGFKISMLMIIAGFGRAWVPGLFGWVTMMTGLVLMAMGLVLEWNLAAVKGGPWARPNVLECLGDVDVRL